jgi:Flp pilus assembly protein TadD
MSAESAETTVQQATVEFLARRSEVSQKLFEQAALEDPDNMEAHYGAGLLALACGELEKAQSAFERALLLKPKHPNILYHLGLISEIRGDFVTASRLYSAGLDMSPSHKKLIQRRARLNRGQCQVPLASRDRESSRK